MILLGLGSERVVLFDGGLIGLYSVGDGRFDFAINEKKTFPI